jgi:hypothetical protein
VSSRQGRRRRSKSQDPAHLWRAVPAPPEVEPVVPAADPSVVLRSLGDPPLPGQGAVAEHYLAAVVDRAAGLAAALAAAAGVLATDDLDDLDD